MNKKYLTIFLSILIFLTLGIGAYFFMRSTETFTSPTETTRNPALMETDNFGE